MKLSLISLFFPLLASRANDWQQQGTAGGARRKRSRAVLQKASICHRLPNLKEKKRKKKKVNEMVCQFSLNRFRRATGMIVFVSGFIFFSVEESKKAGILQQSRAALAQNNAIRAANEKLEETQKLLREQEESLADKFEQKRRRKEGKEKGTVATPPPLFFNFSFLTFFLSFFALFFFFLCFAGTASGWTRTSRSSSLTRSK